MKRGIDFGPVRGTNDAGHPFDFDPEKVDTAIARLRAVATGDARADYRGVGYDIGTDLAMVLDWEQSIRRGRDNSMRMSKAQNTVIGGLTRAFDDKLEGVFDIEALMARLGELVKGKGDGQAS